MVDRYRINLNYKYENLSTRYDIPENGSFTATYSNDQTKYTIFDTKGNEICKFNVDYQKERPVHEYVYPNHVSYIEVLPNFTSRDSQTKDSDNHVVQDYSEEYEVSPYGSEEALDTLGDLKISMSTEKDLDLKHLSFLIENTSDKEYQYSPDYFEIEAEQSGTWYQLEQLDDPSKSNEKDCFIKPNERLTLEIDVKSFYGELPAGHYRLIKQFAFFESERDWDYDTYNLSCEFTIR